MTPRLSGLRPSDSSDLLGCRYGDVERLASALPDLLHGVVRPVLDALVQFMYIFALHGRLSPLVIAVPGALRGPSETWCETVQLFQAWCVCIMLQV